MEPVLYDESELSRICQRWRITELSLFGSANRSDFHAESDVDLLVRFEADSRWSGWDLVDLQDELQRLFGRDVDLVEPASIKNPHRQHSVFENRRVIYAS